MAKKTKKKETVSVPEFLGGGLTYIYLILIMGVFPVYYPGTLIGLQAEKTNYFLVVATVYICLMAVFFIGRGMTFYKERRKIRFEAGDIFMAVFAVAVLISTLLAPDRVSAFMGNSGIRTGAAVMLLCIASYYAVRVFARWDKAVIWSNLLASAFIYLSGVLLTCRVDLLNMQVDIMDEQKSTFISPIGNIDYNVSYVSLILPAAMAMFLFTKETLMKRVLAVYLYIGFMDIFCLRTESGVVMLAAVFAILLYFSLEHAEWFSRYLLVVQIFIASSVSVYLLKERMYPILGIGAFLLKTETIILEVAVFAVLFWARKMTGRLKEERMPRLKKIYGIVFLAMVIAAAAVLVGVNLFFKNTAEGTAFAGLVLNDGMASGRGYIWIRSVELFLKQPFPNKLFGCGLASFYDFVYPAYGEEMIARSNSVFYDPHNDFLWILTTTGIVGAVGFFGSVIAAVRAAIKRGKDHPMVIMAVMSVAGFLVQGLVNSYTIFVIPIFFVILGFAYVSSAKE